METKCGLESPRFPMGRLRITPGVQEVLSPLDVIAGLDRHARGDWGDIPEADWRENNLALRQGLGVVSLYYGENGTRFWIITKHDRSETIVVLQNKYQH